MHGMRKKGWSCDKAVGRSSKPEGPWLVISGKGEKRQFEV